MSRTTLCIATAAGLAALSVALMIGRYRVLGDEIKVPLSPTTWKVSMVVQGKCQGSDAKLTTAAPLDFGHQHIHNESCRSNELYAKPPDARHPERHQVLWTQRPGTTAGPFKIVYQFYCTTDVRTPSAPMARLARTLNAAPAAGTLLQSEARIEVDHPEITAAARQATAGLEDRREQLGALYHLVDEQIANEPNVAETGPTALECLRAGSGDAGAKSRLLVALCRNRGIPARLVTGLALKHGHEQRAHVWVEAWVHDRWLPACPSYHHLGRAPATYLVFSYGDLPVVRGRNVTELTHAFLVEHPAAERGGADAPVSAMHRLFTRLSLYALPPAEQRLVEFLLLLPIAALIVCVYRNIIGLGSFGTFAPALIGLAFRDLGGLPGILVFITIVLLGWLMRRVLDRYHLLQVPRTACLLTLVVFVLIAAIVAANYQDLPATKYISLFPMVILTGMIERFWTLEVEDSTAASFRTLLSTLIIAASISLFLSLHAVVRHMFRFPETLGLIMAAQLLIGRYTGYRFSEWLRFRDLIVRDDPALQIPG